MQDAEAQRQIHQMVNFILNEARDKAQEIEAKAIEDFNIEKLKLVQQMKNKVRQEYQQKAKQMETQRAIARSTAINKARLKKIGARNVAVEKTVSAAGEQLAKTSSNASQYKALCVDLITEGLLRLLEEKVYVRCRREDEQVIRDCLPLASKKYSSIISKEANASREVKVTIDAENYLSPGPSSQNPGAEACLGGVVITTANRKIVIDNTLDARLQCVVKDCLPAIRQLLFPVQ